MSEATRKQIELFKELYCKGKERRLTIYRDFEVEIESYEELLPGNTIRSYATGNREIDGSFIIFRVIDTTNDIVYYPVFSVGVGRELANQGGLKLPSKITVFKNDGNGANGGGVNRGDTKSIKRKDDNKEMLQLIQFARSMMILHVNEPRPMGEPFKGIYDKLEACPRYEVFESDIKSVNSAISHFLNGSTNKRNENFLSLQDYIAFLQEKYPTQNLRNYDFQILRNKMIERYPDEIVVF